jgi:DNA-binding MarR family transcriptional regulator
MSNQAVQDRTIAPLELANSLRPVVLRISRELRRELHSIGVTPGQVSLLVAIRNRPGIGVGELADLERMSAPGMSGHVERLVKAGLVERTRDERGDRRRVGLTVTREGHNVLRSVRSRRTAWLAARLGELDPDERSRIADAIEPLARLLGGIE